jgi:thiamine-monophosphate kinase
MRARRTIAQVGELAWIATLLPTLRTGSGVRLGPGDDCAIVQSRAAQILCTVDALVEGVHFRRAWLAPHQLGRKAFLVNASDIAAMGGAPRWCVANVCAPATTPAADLTAISRGIAAAARACGAVLVGGNLARARQLSIAVTLLGDAPRHPLTRAGARVGDLLYVTGTLGDAALGVRELRRDAAARSAAVRRFREPIPRLAIGQALARRRLAHALIDVSDGLVQDLRHLCAASGVGARLELAEVPRSPRVRAAGRFLALTGGEDYELLCAVPAHHRAHVERLAARRGCRITRIGECTAAADGVQVIDPRGRPLAIGAGGYDHFSRSRTR